MKRILSMSILAVLGCGPQALTGQSQNYLTDRAVTQIGAHFAEFAGSRPGYAVGVIEEGELRYAKGFGSANLDYDLPIGPTTVFNVASLSKQFTATAVAILILREQLSLTDPVSEHIEEWPAQFAEVQVQHLVYMTSGLPEYYTLDRPGGRSWGMDYFTVTDAVAAVLARPDLEFSPGSQWAYSNTNYQVLAEIVSRRSGMPFGEFILSEVFEPLGMDGSLVNDDLGRVIPADWCGASTRAVATCGMRAATLGSAVTWCGSPTTTFR